MDDQDQIPPAGTWPQLHPFRWTVLAVGAAVGLGGGGLIGLLGREPATLGLLIVTFGTFLACAAAGRDTRAGSLRPVFGPGTVVLAAVATMALGATAGAAGWEPLLVAVPAAVGLFFTARADRRGRLSALNRPREWALYERRFAAEAVTRRAVVTGVGMPLPGIDPWGRVRVDLTLRYTDGQDDPSTGVVLYAFPVHLPPQPGTPATVRYLADNPGDRRVEFDPHPAPDTPPAASPRA